MRPIQETYISRSPLEKNTSRRLCTRPSLGSIRVCGSNIQPLGSLILLCFNASTLRPTQRSPAEVSCRGRSPVQSSYDVCSIVVLQQRSPVDVAYKVLLQESSSRGLQQRSTLDCSSRGLLKKSPPLQETISSLTNYDSCKLQLLQTKILTNYNTWKL